MESIGCWKYVGEYHQMMWVAKGPSVNEYRVSMCGNVNTAARPVQSSHISALQLHAIEFNGHSLGTDAQQASPLTCFHAQNFFLKATWRHPDDVTLVGPLHSIAVSPESSSICLVRNLKIHFLKKSCSPRAHKKCQWSLKKATKTTTAAVTPMQPCCLH